VADPPDGIRALAAALAAGGSTSEELVLASLDRAEAERGLNAFVHLRRDGALADARAADARLRGGEPRSLLEGVPVAIKDNMVLAGEPTTCASRILAGYVSPFTATAVERLRTAGAVVIGSTNMDEFAMGSSTEHSAAGPARNPWDPRTPGWLLDGRRAAGSYQPRSATTQGRIRCRRACGVVGLPTRASLALGLRFAASTRSAARGTAEDARSSSTRSAATTLATRLAPRPTRAARPGGAAGCSGSRASLRATGPLRR
jgi:hypothetical protein